MFSQYSAVQDMPPTWNQRLGSHLMFRTVPSLRAFSSFQQGIGLVDVLLVMAVVVDPEQCFGQEGREVPISVGQFW